MELKTVGNRMASLFKKYRYVMLVLIIGLVLMLIPSGKMNDEDNGASRIEESVHEQTLDEQLAGILSKVSGAGKVNVLLTKGEGELTVYQTDSDISDRENETSQRNTTVTVTDSERNQTGLIRQVNPPKYLGAIILCEGADDPTVRLAVTEAVSKATGLGMDRISVLKMK